MTVTEFWMPNRLNAPNIFIVKHELNEASIKKRNPNLKLLVYILS